MAKHRSRCPPGVFCLDTITIVAFLILITIFAVVLFGYQSKVDEISEAVLKQTNNITKLLSKQKQDVVISSPGTDDIEINNVLPSEVSVEAPLDRIRRINELPRKQTYGMPRGSKRRGVPINVQTRGRPQPPQQVGIISATSGPSRILPLMGQRLTTNRDNFRYYTISDSNVQVRLPVTSANRNCASELGCAELFDGDKVYVEGYNDIFKVTIYENADYEYIPYI